MKESLTGEWCFTRRPCDVVCSLNLLTSGVSACIRLAIIHSIVFNRKTEICKPLEVVIDGLDVPYVWCSVFRSSFFPSSCLACSVLLFSSSPHLCALSPQGMLQ
jgi:hypothetical protein